MTAVRQAHERRFWFSNKVINHRFKRENVPGLGFLGMGSKLDHIFRILFSVSTSNLIVFNVKNSHTAFLHDDCG